MDLCVSHTLGCVGNWNTKDRDGVKPNFFLVYYEQQIKRDLKGMCDPEDIGDPSWLLFVLLPLKNQCGPI